MSTMTEIEIIEKHAENIRNGLEKVKPGMEACFTDGCVEGDAIWQGALLLVISGDIPEDFVVNSDPKRDIRQLVPGNTIGAKHCLESLEGIQVFYPKEWNAESLLGPFISVASGHTAVVTHPVHGNVLIPGRFNVQTYYQKEYDKEMEKERRAKD